MRSCGKLDIGVEFSHVGNWKRRDDAHRDLKRPWSGVTAYFDYDCFDTDAATASIWSVMRQNQHCNTTVHFDGSKNTDHDSVPYSEVYEQHPHFMIATANGSRHHRIAVTSSSARVIL